METNLLFADSVNAELGAMLYKSQGGTLFTEKVLDVIEVRIWQIKLAIEYYHCCKCRKFIGYNWHSDKVKAVRAILSSEIRIDDRFSIACFKIAHINFRALIDIDFVKKPISEIMQRLKADEWLTHGTECLIF